MPPPPPFPQHLSVGAHKNIVSIYALSDVAGSEGVIMEVAVCDLLAATMGTSNPAFTLDQILR